MCLSVCCANIEAHMKHVVARMFLTHVEALGKSWCGLNV